MAANAAFFPNASHSNFDGVQFNVTQNIHSLAIDPLDILHKHRALEASHTSKTAASAPKCKPGTRKKAIADLTTWAKELAADPDSSVQSVLWFRGPAGSGKTCIIREVARICRQDGVLLGDYFFSTRVPGLDDEAPFVATIVSHLITVIPALEHPVCETIRSNRTIFEHSLELQLEELLSKHIASIPPQSPRILIVDGFDECRDQKQRARLLHLLYSLVSPPHSLRIIMASRPELDIRTAFDRPPLKSITKILRLENYEASGEIYQYLSNEFTRIRETHPAKQSIPSEWPGQRTLHALTDKSSGGYIFPSVVIKYVDNPRRHPVQLLEHVLDASATASSGRPFAELDALYKIILNPPDIDILLMKRLLHVVIETTCFLSSHTNNIASSLMHKILSAPRLDEFLSLEKGTTEMALCDLHSVLSVAEDADRPWIYFHHKSLEDYLRSPERAGDLYQSQGDTHFDILTVSIHNLKLWNRKLVSPNADFRTVDPVLDYSCWALKGFLFHKKCFPPSVLDFDARIVWRCSAFAYKIPVEKNYLKEFVNSFHNAMCKEGVECQRSCASFRRMLEYRESLYQIVDESPFGDPMGRLKRFEEKCQGLFAPLDLSAPMGAFTTILQDNESVLLPLPKTSSKSGPGKVGSSTRCSIPESESTSMPKRPRSAQDRHSIGTSQRQASGQDGASVRLPPSKPTLKSGPGKVGRSRRSVPKSTPTASPRRSKRLQTASGSNSG